MRQLLYAGDVVIGAVGRYDGVECDWDGSLYREFFKISTKKTRTTQFLQQFQYFTNITS